MIEFSCNCGFRFSVPQDMSGGMIQCPQCKRLNDVPLLSDLGRIDDDGIYKLDSSPPTTNDPDRVDQLTRVFTRERFDAEGFDIDNRGMFVPDESSGLDPLPGMPDGKPVPKYDPFTGELIREIEIKPGDDPAAVPLAGRARVAPPTVVNGMDVPDPLEVFRIPARLFRPINLVVFGFLLLAQFLAQMMFVAIAMNNWMLFPFWLGVHVAVIGHFGNVVDETGPTSRSELPALMRSMQWDDIGTPFFRIIFALLICYGPALLMLLYRGTIPPQALLPLAGTMALAGTLFFPAIVLTILTSGSILNLRPDRVLGAAMICGGEYLVTIISWIVGGACYAFGVWGITELAAGAMNGGGNAPSWLRWYVAYAAVGIGIFALHFLAWHLGVLYRRHHGEFPWVYQHHTKTAKGFAVAPLPRKGRARGGAAQSPIHPR